MKTLLYPEEVDQRLNWPLGRTERLARQRRLPYILLPDGSRRFNWCEIERLCCACRIAVGRVVPNEYHPRKATALCQRGRKGTINIRAHALVDDCARGPIPCGQVWS